MLTAFTAEVWIASRNARFFGSRPKNDDTAAIREGGRELLRRAHAWL